MVISNLKKKHTLNQFKFLLSNSQLVSFFYFNNFNVGELSSLKQRFNALSFFNSRIFKSSLTSDNFKTRLDSGSFFINISNVNSLVNFSIEKSPFFDTNGSVFLLDGWVLSYSQLIALIARVNKNIFNSLINPLTLFFNYFLSLFYFLFTYFKFYKTLKI